MVDYDDLQAYKHCKPNPQVVEYGICQMYIEALLRTASLLWYL